MLFVMDWDYFDEEIEFEFIIFEKKIFILLNLNVNICKISRRLKKYKSKLKEKDKLSG